MVNVNVPHPAIGIILLSDGITPQDEDVLAEVMVFQDKASTLTIVCVADKITDLH
jgi:hypothetical protein